MALEQLKMISGDARRRAPNKSPEHNDSLRETSPSAAPCSGIFCWVLTQSLDAFGIYRISMAAMIKSLSAQKAPANFLGESGKTLICRAITYVRTSVSPLGIGLLYSVYIRAHSAALLNVK
jgi:hypothetical protein